MNKYQQAAEEQGFNLYTNSYSEYICLREEDIEDRLEELIAEKIEDEEEMFSGFAILSDSRIQQIKESLNEQDAINSLSGRTSFGTEEEAWEGCCKLYRIKI
jgi:hypothetical protein